MTKKDFDKEFKEHDLKYIAWTFEKDNIIDVPARCEAYNNKVDDYFKSGLITERQANTWCIPEAFKKTRHWFK